jgi:urease accessory protein
MATEGNMLLLLLNWMSPTFPIGAFAYSHGLEQAVADRRLRSAEDVESWIRDLLQCGSGWNDALLFALCWTEDAATLNKTALALAGSAERHMETTHLGRNFNMATAIWTRQVGHSVASAYPVAAGSACAAAGIDRLSALTAFMQGYCAALVSAAVRLVPLGQTHGLVILRNLVPVVTDCAAEACRSGLDDLGSSCVAAEIAAMRHETLEPRIFRT